MKSFTISQFASLCNKDGLCISLDSENQSNNGEEDFIEFSYDFQTVECNEDYKVIILKSHDGSVRMECVNNISCIDSHNPLGQVFEICCGIRDYNRKYIVVLR